MSDLYLSDAEVAEICDPVRQPAAQTRYLTNMGLHVRRKPNGRPLVARAEFLRAMVRQSSGAECASANQGEAQPGAPNREALVLMFNRRQRGAPAQK